MANLIDNTFFQNELSLGIGADAASILQLNQFIDYHEPKFLEALLGYKLKKAYDTGIVGNVQKYKDIRDGKEFENPEGILTKWPGLVYTNGTSKESPIAEYIYYKWMLNKNSSTTVSGEKKTKVINAVDHTPRYKMANAWNRMAERNWKLLYFLQVNEDLYPEFEDHDNIEDLNELLTSCNPLF